MTGRYASTTTTPVARTRDEIEKTLTRYGAVRFAYGWDDTGASVAFTIAGRTIRFVLPLPDRRDPQFTHTRTGRVRTADGAAQEYEQAMRSRWRSLLLIIKAKLEAVESGIVTLEDEFAMWTVLPDGRTVAEWLRPQIEASYSSGAMPSLLAIESRPS